MQIKSSLPPADEWTDDTAMVLLTRPEYSDLERQILADMYKIVRMKGEAPMDACLETLMRFVGKWEEKEDTDDAAEREGTA